MAVSSADLTQKRIDSSVWRQRHRVEDALVPAAARDFSAYFNAEALILERMLEAKLGPLDTKGMDLDALSLGFTRTYWDGAERRLKKVMDRVYATSSAA